MSEITIPGKLVTVTVEDATVDLVCFDYAQSVLRDRRKAGTLRGYVEATLAANPGLAALGAVLPLGTKIALPDFIISNEGTRERLWD